MAVHEPYRYEPQGRYNLVAVYEDMDRARAAMQELERAGVDGVHISLEGAAAREAGTDLDARAMDHEGLSHVARRIPLGVMLGAAAGALAGLLGGVMYNIVTGGELIDRAVAIAVAAGAFGGSAVGGIYGGIAGVSMTPGWELTFEDVGPGLVTIAVRSDDPTDIERARKAIAATNPVRVDAAERERRER